MGRILNWILGYREPYHYGRCECTHAYSSHFKYTHSCNVWNCACVNYQEATCDTQQPARDARE